MASNPAIHGYCHPQFSAVRRLFMENFIDSGEVGASVSLCMHGEPVVNLWAGHTSWTRLQRWKEDTLVNIFSGTKGVTAICALMLVDRGLLDLDVPVAQYWPAFAQKGKAHIPVKWVLNHKAAVTGVRRRLLGRSLYNWKTMSNALAAQQPWWEPGSKHGYHALSYGWIMGEIIKSITGKTVGQFVADEIAQPLDIDLHIGMDKKEHSRIAPIILPVGIPEVADTWRLIGACVTNPLGVSSSAILNPITIATGVNSKQWRSGEIPAANAHCTALALAKLYGALAFGGDAQEKPLVSADTLRFATEESSFGHDYVLKMDTRFSMGFMLNQKAEAGRFGPGKRSFGHNGAGGSFAFADPDVGLSYGYVMNRMGSYLLMDPRSQRLIDAAYCCL